MMILRNAIKVTSWLLQILFSGVLLSGCTGNTAKTDSAAMPADELIRLSDAQIQLANIKIAEAREGTISSNLLLTASLKVNEQSSVSISSRSEGRIEKLFFRTTGEKVNRGDSLYKFYSDDLVAAQREYSRLQVNNWNYSGQYPPSLLIENNLQFLGMVPSQIEQLKKDGKIMFTITILSQVKGIIRTVNVTEGQYVKAGEKLFELAEDNSLWVEAQAYPEDLPYLKVGMPAKVILPSGLHREIKTRIGYINPSFEPGKNVIMVRCLIENADKQLMPGMLAILRVGAQTGKGIIVPKSSVIHSKNASKVWIRDDNGAFSDRTVTTGIQSSDSVLILTGLERSLMVVTSGVYLLNSEMILKKGNSSAMVVDF